MPASAAIWCWCECTPPGDIRPITCAVPRNGQACASICPPRGFAVVRRRAISGEAMHDPVNGGPRPVADGRKVRQTAQAVSYPAIIGEAAASRKHVRVGFITAEADAD